MNWLGLSLIAATLWGSASVVDKIVVEKHLPSPVLCAFFLGAYGLVSAIVLGLTTPLHFDSPGAIVLGCLSGLLYLGYILLYFAALGHGDTAIVVALSQIAPLFAALWDYLILGQVFGPLTYIGAIGVVVGAGLLSLERRQAAIKSSPRFNKALQADGPGLFRPQPQRLEPEVRLDRAGMSGMPFSGRAWASLPGPWSWYWRDWVRGKWRRRSSASVGSPTY